MSDAGEVTPDGEAFGQRIAMLRGPKAMAVDCEMLTDRFESGEEVLGTVH